MPGSPGFHLKLRKGTLGDGLQVLASPAQGTGAGAGDRAREARGRNSKAQSLPEEAGAEGRP